LEEPASLLDYRGFLATPGKAQLLGVFETPTTAWDFRNPCYYQGFLKPPLLPEVSKTPLLPMGF